MTRAETFAGGFSCFVPFLSISVLAAKVAIASGGPAGSKHFDQNNLEPVTEWDAAGGLWVLADIWVHLIILQQ